MLEKITNFYKKDYGKGLVHGILAMVGIFVAVSFLCRTTGNSGKDVETTIQSIAADQQQAIGSVHDALTANGNAQNSISAASQRIDESRERLSRSAEIALDSARRIEDISNGLKECHELVVQSKRILDDIGEANQIGEGAGKEN